MNILLENTKSEKKLNYKVAYYKLHYSLTKTVPKFPSKISNKNISYALVYIKYTRPRAVTS